MEKYVIKVVLMLHVFLISCGVRGEGSYQERYTLEEQQQKEKQPSELHSIFSPPRSWMNGLFSDLKAHVFVPFFGRTNENNATGPMYYSGVYHLFYQYNPYAAVWENISWAHSVSYNLIDWIHLEQAINPSEPYDVKGCWSGSATILPKDNKPVILYTGDNFSDQQVQNLVMPKNLSDPFLREWVESPHNPLMTPVQGLDPKFFRDPTTAWQRSDNTWRVIVGSQVNGHGAAMLYNSRDFITWERSNEPLHSSNRTKMWECPDFYPVSSSGENGLDTSVNGVGVRHVLKASFNDHDYYVIGSYNDSGKEGFSVDFDFLDDGVGLRYDYGVFYASKSFYDGAKKRRVLWDG